MSAVLSTVAAAAPVAAGWSVHTVWMRRQLSRARRDPLTGLPTRALFETRARKLLSRGPRAVLLADLNRFKELNDTFGHAAGDAAIRTTGRRMARWALDHAGTAARLGGDEFTAVFTVGGESDLRTALTDLAERLNEPFTHQNAQLPVSASIGAVVATGPGTGLPVALRRADEAMYRCKRSGWDWCIGHGNVSGTGEQINGRRPGRVGATRPEGRQQ
ncbi:GGDEF domain-containing protein [Streptomyces sp. WMMC897]|uniref:GGDEF domain-containing protein n=1 Tax=Streptomyces sp. WMMC897 TaxID=3014782 RepID=UPI0022B62FF6|nr:GGDEF domain-containing protein [Streptomyces sp. WMMC897]MCZ7415312.1 GGDEF domain-containing protein [Streptomyces sp. WMMC897]